MEQEPLKTGGDAGQTLENTPCEIVPTSAVETADGQWINPVSGKPACGAKCRSGRRCPMPPVTGNKRCRMHGGKSRRGMASGTFKHGGYSIDLPTHLAAMYQEVLDDPDWLSSRTDIALLRTRLRELIQRLDTGEGGSIFDKLAEIAGEYAAAREAEDIEAALKAADAMVKAAEEGSEYEATWRELQSSVDGISKVRDREVKRMVAQEQILTADQAGVMIAAIISAIKAEVADKGLLDRLGRRIQAITTGKTLTVESKPAISQEPQ